MRFLPLVAVLLVACGSSQAGEPTPLRTTPAGVIILEEQVRCERADVVLYDADCVADDVENIEYIYFTIQPDGDRVTVVIPDESDLRR
jgi:hypothetical protein